MATQERIRFNYRMIISVNTALILLGVFGIMTPAATAYLHNFSTLALSLHSMTDLPVKQRKHVSAETVRVSKICGGHVKFYGGPLWGTT